MQRLLDLLFGEFRISWSRTGWHLVRGRRILIGRRFRVRGVPSLVGASTRLSLGTLPYGFATGRDEGLLRIRGLMRVEGHVAVGVGARIDVGPNAVLDIGRDSYLSPFAKVVVSESVTIGARCAIGWNVQILDDDQHLFERRDGSTIRTSPVVIGDSVWIGSGAMVFKGVHIADGCVIAGGAVVTRSVTEPRSLIAGNPAQVVRTDVQWT